MSEYQYYDFYSIDRSLSKEEIETIRTYSSRVSPSSRRATFVYNYGDFRYSEEEVLNDFFDIMVYMANWGSRRLLMKFPSNLVSYEELKEYEIDATYEFTQEIRVFKKGPNILIDMYHSIEEGYWIEGEGMLDEMLSLRAQILNGDYRVLYLGWLHLVSINPEISRDLPEPSLPSNLNTLDGSLESFVNFWEIDIDLIRSASEKSKAEEIISDEALITQINHLSDREKEQYLSALISNEVRAKNELRKRLLELYQGPKESKKQEPRTLSELMEGMARQHKIRSEEERIEAEKAHQRKMEMVGEEEARLWQSVEENATLKTAKGYDKATEILKDLKQYHNWKTDWVSFEKKMENILRKYGKSVAFKRRLQSNEII